MRGASHIGDKFFQRFIKPNRDTDKRGLRTRIFIETVSVKSVLVRIQ